MKTSLMIAVWGAAAVASIFFFGVFLPSYKFKTVQVQECSVCRTQLRALTSSLSKNTITQYQTNTFSLWYDQTVEPKHAHNWVLKSVTTYNVFGAKNGSASGEKYHFFSINPTIEKEFLEGHFDTNTIVKIAHKLQDNHFSDLIDSSISLASEQVFALSNKVELIRVEVNNWGGIRALGQEIKRYRSQLFFSFGIEPHTPTNAPSVP